jgi:hemolysin III
MFDTDGRPLHVVWNYSRAELIADGVVHALGLTLAAIGTVVLVTLAVLYASPGETTAVVVYAVGLVALLAVSAAYNMWPISPTKWKLRRFDHACIFLLIAATYTPFVTRFPLDARAIALFAGVWTAAICGAAIKLTWPGRYDRLAIAMYLAMGFSGGLAWDHMSASLPGSTVALIVAGGLTYAGGVVFHLWQNLRFQNAVWHGFVLVASVLFYVAVLDGVVLA